MTSCISEPVSYLRLERYSLQELPAEDDRRIAEHLAQCALCRACYERIQTDARAADVAAIAAKLGALEPLPDASRAARPWWGAAAVIASLACLLFVLRPQPESNGIVTQRTTKGAELALELVRADAQGQLLEPTHFAPGDRFKLLVTCPAERAGSVRVLVFQAGEMFEPVPAQVLSSCGNRRALAGAWAFDGDAAADVCVVFAEPGVDLDAVRSADALTTPRVCARVSPAAR